MVAKDFVYVLMHFSQNCTCIRNIDEIIEICLRVLSAYLTSSSSLYNFFFLTWSRQLFSKTISNNIHVIARTYMVSPCLYSHFRFLLYNVVTLRPGSRISDPGIYPTSIIEWIYGVYIEWIYGLYIEWIYGVYIEWIYGV